MPSCRTCLSLKGDAETIARKDPKQQRVAMRLENSGWHRVREDKTIGGTIKELEKLA